MGHQMGRLTVIWLRGVYLVVLKEVDFLCIVLLNNLCGVLLYSAGLVNVFVVSIIRSSVFTARKRVLCITRPVLVVVVKPGRRVSIADGICSLC